MQIGYNDEIYGAKPKKLLKNRKYEALIFDKDGYPADYWCEAQTDDEAIQEVKVLVERIENADELYRTKIKEFSVSRINENNIMVVIYREKVNSVDYDKVFQIFEEAIASYYAIWCAEEVDETDTSAKKSLRRELATIADEMNLNENAVVKHVYKAAVDTYQRDDYNRDIFRKEFDKLKSEC